MRILIAHEAISYFGGGSQIAVFNWLKNLKQFNVKVKFICNKPPNDVTILNSINEQELIFNKSINFNFLYPKLSLSFPFLSQRAVYEIKKFSPQIIHFHEPLIISLALHRLGKKLGSKTLSSYHTNFRLAKVNNFPLSLFFKRNGIFSKFLDRFQLYLLSKSDFVTAPSSYVKKLLLRKMNKKIFLLPYPIPDYFFSKRNIIPKKINKLITVSRISGEKNIDLLIEMMKYLKNRFTLTIVGEGVDRTFLEKKVKKLNLENSIVFAGWIKNEDLPKMLTNHHLFVSSSDYETFGITYIESLACRIPCVVFDYPISREVIPNPMAIFINNLDPKKWAEKLIEIQEKPSIYQKLKEKIDKNYQKLYCYHEEQSTKKLVEIYQKILRF